MPILPAEALGSAGIQGLTEDPSKTASKRGARWPRVPLIPAARLPHIAYILVT